MVEVCRKSREKRKFLRNKREDTRTRKELESFRRGDLQDDIETSLSAGSEIDVAREIGRQDREFLMREEARLLTSPWVKYGTKRATQIDLLRSRVEWIIFRSPHITPNGRTNLPRRSSQN